MSAPAAPPPRPIAPGAVPPGKPEPPVAEMIVRWAAVGCLTTLIVLAVGFVALLVVAGKGIFG
jgi:hypothetical protein